MTTLKPLLKTMSDKKVVLITGCAKGGIGYEYCKAFAEKNCHVFASDIGSRTHELPTESNIEGLELDVSSDESVASAVSSVIAKCGKIDIVINNAGVGSPGPLAELSLDEVRKTWEVNALGQLRVIQNVVPYMAEQRSGRIVNIGMVSKTLDTLYWTYISKYWWIHIRSVVGKVATPWAGSYSTSKASVHSITNTLRLELRPFGIQVLLVIPGAVRSNIGNAGLKKVADKEWKLYSEFKEAIAERANASQTDKSTEATLFAKHVAKKVLSSSPPREIVFGHMTTLFVLLYWSPLWFRDYFFRNRFGLNKKV
ncbi:hypothetical protein GIB67_029967 [Kingdonia uniflora]|uniref:Uncharacterized protein n=1 Tax=Kingdonia uniflora TaxID=39325 RepID=A0A7J7MXP2_9MAGN|nr:hypothetical protein GIB67_029967 [Kingdonia uniflora]